MSPSSNVVQGLFIFVFNLIFNVFASHSPHREYTSCRRSCANTSVAKVRKFLNVFICVLIELIAYCLMIRFRFQGLRAHNVMKKSKKVKRLCHFVECIVNDLEDIS